MAQGELLPDFLFKAPEGSWYLGSFIGDRNLRDAWVGTKVEAWAVAVRDLACVTVRHLQAALTTLTRSLKQEWLYLQRVVPGVQVAFSPIEKVIAKEFIPALVGDPLVDHCSLWCLIALPVKPGKMGLLNLVEMADTSYLTKH